MISETMAAALNEQMNYEFYSANIYLAMSAYCSAKGLDGFASWHYNQYLEEQLHAMKFYHYLLDQNQPVELDAMPKPKKDYGSPLSVFEQALAHERSVTARIYKLVDRALEERDHGTNSFLQWFVNEQVEEESTINGILDKLRLVESSGNGIFMVNNELGQRPAPQPLA
ncbi:ferritin [Desulfuromonas thiophila]|uniref:Ferritin n=1 Tax=Desulfuromonas thiophila TaxID=57664 RepID=A0A1G6YGN9_9BACT|nr:ferritin [Desulfuromonas thiophila]SDD88775.1 ferritin [Desulfuromonas thiophila]